MSDQERFTIRVWCSRFDPIFRWQATITEHGTDDAGVPWPAPAVSWSEFGVTRKSAERKARREIRRTLRDRASAAAAEIIEVEERS